MVSRNWSRNITFGEREIAEPQTVEQLQEVIVSTARVGVIGAAHSFNGLADTDGVMVSTELLDSVVEIDDDASTVTAEGGIRYHQLCDQLHRAGYALHNLMSIPHFSVVGACATGTHGSGDGKGGLSTAIRSMELVDGNGELIGLERGDRDFAGAVIGLGALGVVTQVTLDIQPTFDMAQEVLLELPTATAIGSFDDIMASAYSVSLFTDWQGDTVNQLWRKHQLNAGAAPDISAGFLGARPAERQLTPMGDDGRGITTPQLLAPGPWHERLPHIDPGYDLPPRGELQSEYFVRREDAPAALTTIAGMSELLAPVIRRSEIRTVAGDDAWLSPFRGDTVALHFSWHTDAVAVANVLPSLEARLAEFDPLPHWGKLYAMSTAQVRAGYPAFADFVTLAEHHDPDRRFRNAHLDTLLG